MDTPISAEFDAVCAAIASTDDPFRRFIAALEPDGRIPAQYHRILQQSGSVSFQVATPETWTRSHSQFEVAVGLGVQTQVVITLPDHFSSSSAAAALVAKTGYQNIYHMRRLRHMIGIVVDLVLLRRIDLIRHIRERFSFLPDQIDFVVSYEDYCSNPNVLTLSRFFGHANVLLPDTNYFDSGAYERHKLSVITNTQPWSERSDVVVWRGVTTGSRFTLDDLMTNERIALADYCAPHPDIFDVKITAVVQTQAGEADAVLAALKSRDLFGSWKPFDDFRQHKFVLHIDGNSSAMGLFEKLCLQCCILAVESHFEQWFEPRIKPWVHYVPIRRDYSDLLEKVAFLHANLEFAERIARAAFEFAVKADLPAEAALFVRNLAASLPVSTYRCVLAAPEAEDAGGGWHGIEREPDGTTFRWTNGADVSWPLELPVSFVGVMTVEIPFTSEIRAGFAVECRMIVDGVQHPVEIVGRHLRAQIPVAGTHPLDVVLRTPPPVVPAQEWNSPDNRSLGLAVRVV